MTYYELMKTKNAIVERITEKLRKFGYSDVIVEGIGPYSNKSGGYHLSCNLSVFFWNASYGYMISMSNRSDSCIFDDFIADCDKVIDIAKDSSVLNTDCRKKFEEHLKDQGLSDYYPSKLPVIEEDFLNISFHSAECHIIFHRKNIDLAIADLDAGLIEEYQEDFEEEDCAWLKSQVVSRITEHKLDSTYQYNIDFRWNSITLSIYSQNIQYNLFIQHNSAYDQLGHQILDLISCFILQIQHSSTNLLSDLRSCDFHIHKQSTDRLSAIVCEELDIFSITAWMENPFINGKEKVSLLSPRPKINFDNMNGNDFEHFCAKVLRNNGFEKVLVTQGSGDQGVDIIAFKDGIKYGVQCKCYSSDIGNKAVQEVLSGKTYYDCDVGVVLTNRHFTKSAIELAQKCRIRLWDRDKLVKMVNSMNSET